MCVFVVGSYSIRVITDDLQEGQVIICGSGPTCGAIITETTVRIVDKDLSAVIAKKLEYFLHRETSTILLQEFRSSQVP